MDKQKKLRFFGIGKILPFLRPFWKPLLVMVVGGLNRLWIFLGFGGVGESGMGSYHGKAGFEAFSHCKSIVDKKTWIDLPMRYQPYRSKLYETLLHIFLR